MSTNDLNRGKEGNSDALRNQIQQEVGRFGFISFARFMELALYSPGLGYYENKEQIIGQKGDFFTNVSVGEIFGRLLAEQFTRWLAQAGFEEPVILEAGAHEGRLAADVLQHLKAIFPKLYQKLSYWILEPSDHRTEDQKERLRLFGEKIHWFKSWTAINQFCDNNSKRLEGIIFSNELLDAFPVYRLFRDQRIGMWQEWAIRMEGDQLTWYPRPLPSQLDWPFRKLLQETPSSQDSDHWIWPDIPEAIEANLPDGFILEVCPSALNWWKEAATCLSAGWLMTCDYGGTSEEFLRPEKPGGTLRAFHRHRHQTDLLNRPGQQDLTANVNFSVLKLAGESRGGCTVFWGDQEKFLAQILNRIQQDNPTMDWSVSEIRQIQTLVHPTQLGKAFKTLVQSFQL